MNAVEERELRVAKEYINNNGKTIDAMVKAGFSQMYANKRGYEYIRRPGVQKFLIKWRKKMENNTGIKKDWVIHKLKKIVDEAIPDDGIVNIPLAIKAVNALAEISKIMGFNAPEKHEVDLKYDKDIIAGRILLKELLEKNKKDY